MPKASLENIAKKSGTSLADIKKYEKEAKRAARKEGFSEDDDAFWAYTMAIVKKRAGLSKDSIAEMHEILKYDPVLRLKRIVEFTGDKATTLLLWESCKTQSLAWQVSNKADKDATMNYAFSILETATYFDKGIVSEGFFSSNAVDKKRKKIDKNIKKLLSREEMKKLTDDGYDIDEISDDELDSLEKQIKKIHKDKNVAGFGGLLGTVVLGFVGGIAAAKAIDSFFGMFRD